MLRLVKRIVTGRLAYCLASLARVAKLIKGARKSHTLVIHGVIPEPITIEDKLSEVKSLGFEPVVKAGPDKFIHISLDKILKNHGIATVMTVGSVAEAAALYAASHEAMLGFKVIAPVDGMSSVTHYVK